MSGGGSFGYLYNIDAGDLIGYGRERDLERMADRLAELGYADDAAVETREILLEVRRSRNRIQTSINRLAKLWRAVEWCDSCDDDEAAVKKSLEKYRGGTTP